MAFFMGPGFGGGGYFPYGYPMVMGVGMSCILCGNIFGDEDECYGPSSGHSTDCPRRSARCKSCLIETRSPAEKILYVSHSRVYLSVSLKATRYFLSAQMNEDAMKTPPAFVTAYFARSPRGRRGSGVRGRKGSGVRGRRGSGVRGRQGSGVRGRRGSGVRGRQGSGVRGRRGSGVRGAPRQAVHRPPLHLHRPPLYRPPLHLQGHSSAMRCISIWTI
jgi:hypothetical protein